MEKRPLSKLAVVSLILSLITPVFIAGIILTLIIYSPSRFCGNEIINILLVLGIIDILAMLLGAKALKQIKQNNLRGKTMAIIGIIISFIISFLILSILIPNNTGHGGFAYNETKAVETLRQIAKAEEIWKQKDYDRNGINDYWTYDVSCFYRLHYKDGTSLMPKEIVKADDRKAPFDIPSNIELIEESNWQYGYSGYHYQSMLTDENGVPYNQNPVGTNKTLATNTNKYAFVAYPDAYATSGINTFIVNEKGVVYTVDTGSEFNKIILTWPGTDPTKIKGPGERFWRVAD